MIRLHSLPPIKSNISSGFTLLELLIVIGLLSILAVVVVLILNPQETLKKARDSQRLSDLAALHIATHVTLLEQANQGGNPDPDGPSYVTSCSGEATQKLFVSVPSDNGETSPTPPSGWTIQRVTAANAGKIDGTGWFPIDFRTALGGTPISNLPLDPINTFASGNYYAYTCARLPQYALTTKLEARLNQPDQPGAAGSKDGGISYDLYELGTNLAITPEFTDRSLVGFWKLDDGSGQTAQDYSQYNNDGMIGDTGGVDLDDPTWLSGASCKSGSCLGFDGVDDQVTISSTTSLEPAAVTVVAWVRRNGAQDLWAVLVNKSWNNQSGPTNNSYSLRLNSGGTGNGKPDWEYGYSGGNYELNSPGEPITDVTWLHLAGAYDPVGVSPQLRTYVSGALNASATQTNSMVYSTSGNGLFLGGDVADSSVFTGRLDEIRIYNRVLPAEEILALSSQ